MSGGFVRSTGVAARRPLPLLFVPWTPEGLLEIQGTDDTHLKTRRRRATLQGGY